MEMTTGNTTPNTIGTAAVDAACVVCAVVTEHVHRDVEKVQFLCTCSNHLKKLWFIYKLHVPSALENISCSTA